MLELSEYLKLYYKNTSHIPKPSVFVLEKDDSINRAWENVDPLTNTVGVDSGFNSSFGSLPFADCWFEHAEDGARMYDVPLVHDVEDDVLDKLENLYGYRFGPGIWNEEKENRRFIMCVRGVRLYESNESSSGIMCEAYVDWGIEARIAEDRTTYYTGLMHDVLYCGIADGELESQPITLYSRSEESEGRGFAVKKLLLPMVSNVKAETLEYQFMSNCVSSLHEASSYALRSIDNATFCESTYKQKIKLKANKKDKSHHKISNIVVVKPKNHKGELSQFASNYMRGDWTHGWWVRGHWRECKGLGKNRLGERIMKGKTWVIPHTKKDELGIIEKTRIVK